MPIPTNGPTPRGLPKVPAGGQQRGGIPTAPRGGQSGQSGQRGQQHAGQQGAPGQRGIPTHPGTEVRESSQQGVTRERNDELPEMTFGAQSAERIAVTSTPGYGDESRGQIRASQQRAPREPIRNEYDAPDDDTFSPIDEQEQERERREAQARELAAQRAETERRQRAVEERERQLQEEADAREIREWEERQERERARQAAVDSREPEDADEDELIGEEDARWDEDNLLAEDLIPKKDKSSKGASKRGAKQPKKRGRKRNIDDDGRESFVDKTGKVKPFGGRKVKERDVDARANFRKKSQAVQFSIIGLLAVLVGVGAYNAIVPAPTLSEEDVSALVAEQTGDYGFPTESGASVATGFIDAYLTSGKNSDTLVNYYSGVGLDGDSAASADRVMTSTLKQSIVQGPKVYETIPLTATSTGYTVGALIESENADPQATPEPGTAEAPKQLRWVFFRVNVYFNEAQQSLTISQDSPSIVPSVEIGTSSELPLDAPIGTGEADDALAEEIRSVVHGFIEGYVRTSPTDHSPLDQYVISGAPATLLKGLDNTYTLRDNEVGSSVEYTAYATETPGEVKALIRVEMETVIDEATRSSFTSTYVMTLQKQSNGKYLVSQFNPYSYVPEPESEAEMLADAAAENGGAEEPAE